MGLHCLLCADHIESDQADLVVHVKAVRVVLVEDKLDQRRGVVHMHRLQLSGLEATALVAFEIEEAKFAKLNLTEGQLVRLSTLREGVVDQYFDSLADLRLVREELQLLQRNDLRELNDQLLRVLAVASSHPATAVHCGVQQLGGWVLGVFARDVHYAEFELNRLLRHNYEII